MYGQAGILAIDLVLAALQSETVYTLLRYVLDGASFMEDNPGQSLSGADVAVAEDSIYRM